MAINPTKNAFFSQTTFFIFLIILLWGVYRGISEWQRDYPDSRSNLIQGDLANYSALQTALAYPENFARDPIYGDAEFNRTSANYKLIYLKTLQLSTKLAGNDLERGQYYFRALLQTTYILGMFLWLKLHLEDEWIALLVAFISVIPSGFTVTGTRWGISQEVVPLVIFNAFIPYWLYIFDFYFLSPKHVKATFFNTSIIIFLVFCLGILLIFLNAVLGLNFGQFIGIIILLQWWRGRLDVRLLLAYGVSFGLIASFFYLFWGTDNSSGTLTNTWESAQAFINSDKYAMVFPWWQHNFFLRLKIGQVELYTVLFLTSHAVVSLLCLLTYLISKNRLMQFLFIGLQVFYMLIFMYTGWLPIILLIVAWHQWRHKTSTETDFALWIVLWISLVLGPLQQSLLYYAWKTWHVIAVTGLLFEIGRFLHFAYLPFYLLIGRAILHYFPQKKPLWLWSLQIFAMGASITVNLNSNLFVSSDFINLSTLILVVMTLASLDAITSSTRYWRPAYAICLIGIGASIGFHYLTLNPPIVESSYVVNSDFLEMTDWIQTNTSPDSLLLITNLDPSFRYYTKRPVLLGSRDFIYGTYTGLTPSELQKINDSIQVSRQDSTALATLAHIYQVDYLVVSNAEYANVSISLPPSYSNSTYTIYEAIALHQ